MISPIETKLLFAWAAFQNPEEWMQEEAVDDMRECLTILSRKAHADEKREIMEYLKESKWSNNRHRHMFYLALDLVETRKGKAKSAVTADY